MPGMAADICGVITVVLLAGVMLFVGLGFMPTNSRLGASCIFIGIVMIIISLKSVVES
jgi:membrane-bound ClpP family serine protease